MVIPLKVGGKIPTSPLGKYEFLLRCLVMCKLIRKLDRAGTTQPWTFKIPGENESVREHCTLPSFAFVSFEGFAVHTYVRSKPDSLSPFPIELKRSWANAHQAFA